MTIYKGNVLNRNRQQTVLMFSVFENSVINLLCIVYIHCHMVVGTIV